MSLPVALPVPGNMRRLAAACSDPTTAECLRRAADRIEQHDEVVDGLAAREREKVQAEMAALRARIAVLQGCRVCGGTGVAMYDSGGTCPNGRFIEIPGPCECANHD